MGCGDGQHTAQEVEHQRPDLGGVRLEREMTGIDEMDLGVGNVDAIGQRAGRDEVGIVAPPRHEQRRTMLAQIAWKVG